MEGVKQQKKGNGKLVVKVIEGMNLVGIKTHHKYLMNNSYVILHIGKPKHSYFDFAHQTKAIGDGVNPQWNEEFKLKVHDIQPLYVAVKNLRTIHQDDFLGETEITFHNLSPGKPTHVKKELKGVDQGVIHLELTWLPFQPKVVPQGPDEESSGLIGSTTLD